MLRSQRGTTAALCELAVAECRCLFYTPTVTVTPKQLADELQGLAWDLKLAVEGALNPEEGVPYASRSPRPRAGPSSCSSTKRTG